MMELNKMNSVSKRKQRDSGMVVEEKRLCFACEEMEE
jgi:hypothetical protein